MAPSSLNRREYVAFKKMLESALLEITLPAGIIDTEHIIPGSIRPSNLKMDAEWVFQGGLENSSAGYQTRTQEQEQLNRQPSAAVSSTDYYGSATTSTTRQTVSSNASTAGSDEDVVYLDARRRKVIYTLPPVSKSLGRKVYVKRIDQDANNICRVVTNQDDKIDGTDGVVLTEGQAVILIASKDQWHVFAKLH